LDQLDNKKVDWKSEPASPHYDHRRLAENLLELRSVGVKAVMLLVVVVHPWVISPFYHHRLLVDKKNIRGLVFFLRSRLRRNLHGIDKAWTVLHLISAPLPSHHHFGFVLVFDFTVS